MDKFCDDHPAIKLHCPACNGAKGGRAAKGARSIRKTISCRINAKRPRPGAHKFEEIVKRKYTKKSK